MRFRTAAVGATAALLLAVPVTAAQADPTAPAATATDTASPPAAAPAAPVADPVDVAASLKTSLASVVPGGSFDLRVGGRVVSGAVEKVDVTVRLPAGITYAATGSGFGCRPSADGRSFTCPGRKPLSPGEEGLPVALRVDEDVPVGRELTLTGTVTPVGATDTEPGNDTATATVTAAEGADLAVTWKPGSASVRPGKDFTAELVVTNNGPGTAAEVVVAVYNGYGNAPKSNDKRCWWDPGTAICEEYADLAPGKSVSFPFTWNFAEGSAGKTHKVPARLYMPPAGDKVKENDQDELVVKVLKPAKPTPTPTPAPTAKPTRPTPTPTPTPTASPSSSSPGGSLADTGSGSAGAAAGAVVLLTTGVLLSRNRRRVRSRSRH
ncbi:hypothetical protein ACIRSU_31425 [Streptomyces sp. NPDC101160]|uniref:hypothetical protein n=1 Tax=Streptomyces sp. NPDC101160 TaxID=3366118 RepID=UPI0038193EA7